MSDVQNIAITSTQTVPQPKPHTTYTVQVSTPIRSWTVERRYNDFVSLHAELLSSTNRTPPAQLPPKHPWSLTRSAYDEKIVRERRILLETYLRAILTNKSPIWRDSYTFLDFLAIPQNTSRGRNADGSSGPGDIHWTPANWLTEHAKVEAALRTSRSELLKRDALAGMGDAAGSRTASVSAKKMIRGIGESIDQLSRGLEGIAKAVGEGEKQRREDLIEGLRNERGNLSRMAEAGVRTNREATGGSAGSSLSMPGGTASIWGNGNGGGAGSQVQTGRVFGKKPEETVETRPLDDRGVLQLQQTKMDGQDQQLRELSTILQRQRGMGEEIHREIREQTEILEEIEHGVDKTGGKMARAKRQMNRLN